jgi:hypothetical protein
MRPHGWVVKSGVVSPETERLRPTRTAHPARTVPRPENPKLHGSWLDFAILAQRFLHAPPS